MNVSNADRAEWADVAIAAFAQETWQDKSGDLEHDKQCVVSDLLCNLMHLCRRDGIDFAKCLANGNSNFEEEVEEEREEKESPA
jgi:hypothetical protein